MKLTIDLNKLSGRGIRTEHCSFENDNRFEWECYYELQQPLFTKEVIRSIEAQVGERMCETILETASEMINKKIILEIVSQL